MIKYLGRIGLILFPAVLVFAVMDQYPYLTEAFSRGQPIGRDAYNLWSAGRILLEQGAATPVYDNQAFTAFQTAMAGAGIGWNSYLYPPPGLLIAAWMGSMPYPVALVVYSLVGVLSLAVAVLAGSPQRRQAALLLLLAPMLTMNLIMGQSGLIAAACLLGGLRLLGGNRFQQVLAGLLFGILTFKPILGVLVPVLVLLRRDWRVFWVAVATASWVAVLPAMLWNHVWQDFLAYAVPNQTMILNHAVGIGMLMITSAFNAGRVLGLGLDLSYLLHGGFAVLAVVAFLYCFVPRAMSLEHRQRRLGARDLLVFVLCTSLLSPYLHNYDLILLEAAVVLYCMAQAGSRLDVEQKTLVVIGWSTAFIAPVLNMAGLPLSPLLLTAALLLTIRQRDGSAGATPSAGVV